jgi:3-phosphoshikimate 1-carboxyvinyltransferase
VPSKSQAHRLLILAAFADAPTTLICPSTNKDIDATIACLRSLGATITSADNGFVIVPITKLPESAVLPCGESGSTLRFLLPVCGALGIDTLFHLEGRLPMRPLSPLWEEMERMGCTISRPSANTIRCTGKLKPGAYAIDGSVSSQFITGLLLAFTLIPGESTLEITGSAASRPYIELTKAAIALFGGKARRSPGTIEAEGDWSSAAFFLTAAALGSDVAVTGLNRNSQQGDKAISVLLDELAAGYCTVCAADIPDLVPILAVAAAAGNGCKFTDIQRLRLKESDRVATTLAMLHALGVRAEADESTMTVFPGQFLGGTVDAANDHRIAMAAAIAATVAMGPVTILGAECVQKSYPGFWEDYKQAGGSYELNLR